jgi:uncharacterized membrane protein
MNALHRHIARDGFRLRGTEMSRIDGFSDVVFGFALTLIVVSLEVPHTYVELREVMLGFVPFFICFYFLLMVWWAHFQFFRRYGLHDLGTIYANSALLFCLLFYVYPLKFLFTVATGAGNGHVFSEAHQLPQLMTIYGAGFSAIYLCLTAMYWNAWRQRDALHLNRLERSLTLGYLTADAGAVLAGILCCVVAHLLPPARAGNAGWVFFVIGVYKSIHGSIAGRKARLVREECEEEELSAPVSH